MTEARIVPMRIRQTGRKVYILKKGDKRIGSEVYYREREAISARDRYNSRTVRSSQKIQSDRKLILDAISSGAETVDDIAERLGIDPRSENTDTIRRDAEALEKQGLLTSKIHKFYATVSTHSGYFGGQATVQRRRKHYYVVTLDG